MNNVLWQVALIAAVGFFIALNRAALGDPKWPLVGLAATLAVWLFFALYIAANFLWNRYQGEEVNSLQEMASFGLSIIPIVLMTLFVIKAKGVPPIHDITTDMQNPPLLTQAKQFRHASHNSVAYNNDNVELQQQAYPNITPFMVNLAPEKVLPVVEIVMKNLGWHLYETNSSQGVIEAYDKTALLGFVDDIVVRVDAAGASGSRVDVRSASRVGVSDLGANAARIEQFFRALDSALKRSGES